MMLSKLYLLLAVLCVFVICSTSIELKSRKLNAESDIKKKAEADIKNDDYEKDKDKDKDEIVDDRKDESLPQSTSFFNTAYTGQDPPESNYRTRPRWQPPPQPELRSSSYNDFMNKNDRSRFDNLFDGNGRVNNGPSCYSLVDPQYPIFADMCGAVPQARYALPNTFGHRDRWQIAQLLVSLFGVPLEPSCTRALRLLLCPVLFPPCQNRYEPTVLPCQSYCRAVKARCATPILEFLPCERLPYSSDICPITQPYDPLMPLGGFPPMGLPLAMASGPPIAQQFPSLQSLFSSPNLQAALASFPLSSMSSSSPQALTPLNLYGGASQTIGGSQQMFPDLSSNPYANNYLQTSGFAPITRSATETRPTADKRPSAASSVVKA